MKKIIFCLILWSTIINSIYAANYSKLTVFGDSLSVKGVLGKTWPVWPEYLATDITVSQNAENMAVAGARSYDIFNQVSAYIASNQIDPDVLYAVFGGTNDLSSNGKSIQQSVEALHNAGAKYILVSNLDDNPRRYSPFIDNYNINFLNDFNNSDANVILMDTYTLFEEIHEDPSLFGFDSADDVFFDGLHFAESAHEILGDYFSSVLSAPLIVSLLPEIVLSEIRGNNAGINDLLNSQTEKPENKKFLPFFSFNYGTSELDSINGYASYEADDIGIKGGGMYNISENWDIGFLLSFSSMTGDFGDFEGSYELTSEFFSFVSHYTYNRISLDFAYILGVSSFDSISRELNLGSLTRDEEGSTDADNSSIFIKAKGVLIQKNNFTLSPYLSFTSSSITVDSYKEESTHASAMNYATQDRDSNILAFGLYLNYQIQNNDKDISYYALLEVGSDSEDNDRTVEAGVKTLEGSSFSVPGFTPDSSVSKLQVGVTGNFNENWAGNASFLYRQGDNGNDSNLEVSVKRTFPATV